MAVRGVPRREQDSRDKRVEELERKNAKLDEDLARTTRDRDRWKRRSEHLKKQLDDARRAGATASRALRQGPAARAERAPWPPARCTVRPAGLPPTLGAGRRDSQGASADGVSRLRRCR